MVVGVLGGGQLGRMLCQAASQMAIKVMVLDPQDNCPASSLSYHHMVGSFDDSATVQEFAKRFTLFETGFVCLFFFLFFNNILTPLLNCFLKICHSFLFLLKEKDRVVGNDGVANLLFGS